MERACKRKAASGISEERELGSSVFEDSLVSQAVPAAVGSESSVLAGDSGFGLSKKRMADGSETTISVLREELEGTEDREERSPELSESVDEDEAVGETSTRELMKLFHGFMKNNGKG